MNTAAFVVKCAGAWICLIGAIALLIFVKDIPMATCLGVVSLAFSQAPA